MTTTRPAGRLGWDRAGQNVPERLPGAVFEDFNLLRAAALAGQGVALCSLAMIRPDLAEGRLIQLSDISVLESLDYYSDAIQPDPDRCGAAPGASGLPVMDQVRTGRVGRGRRHPRQAKITGAGSFPVCKPPRTGRGASSRPCPP